MGNITSEDTVIALPALRIKCKISKWDNYELGIDSKGIKFILASSADVNDSFNYEFIEDGSILFNLMKLYKNIYIKDSSILLVNQAYINSKISTPIISLIIDFCRKYGLPFWNNEITNNTFINVESDSEELFSQEPSYTNKMAFPVCSFIRGLVLLHADFIRLIDYKLWENDEIIKNLLTDSDINILNNRTNSSHFDIYTPTICDFATKWDNENGCLNLQCENIMHVSVYHLCILYQSDNFNECGGSWRICHKCGKVFYAKRSDQKYCYDPCTKASAWIAKKRAIQKQEQLKESKN